MSTTYPRTLRRNLVIVALALITVIQLAAVGFSGYVARKSSMSVAEDAIHRDGNTTVEAILRHLDPAEQSVDVTARLLAGDLLELSHPELERYLHSQLAVISQVAGAFIGFPDGSFVFVTKEEDGFRAKRITMTDERTVTVERFDSEFELQSTEVVLDDVYNPVERPWYGLAVASDATAWTDPYVFFTSQQPGVTASRAVRVDGELIAVVGIDIELKGVAEFLDETASTESGEAFVVSGDNVVAAPSHYQSQVIIEDSGDVRLITTDELGVPDPEATGGFSVSRVSTDGEDGLVLRKPFPAGQGPDWDVVVRAPESELTEIIAGQQRTTLLIVLGGGAFVLLALAILWRVSRPIKDLHAMASTDPLTGLANRRQIEEEARRLMKAMPAGHLAAVLAVDLDGFKALNDNLGHHAGDRALITVANCLRQLTRDVDVVGRLGGDEFVVVMTVHDESEAIAIANRILITLRERLETEFYESGIGASGGLAVSDGDDELFETLRDADRALITAKLQSRGMLQLSERVVERIEARRPRADADLMG